MANGLTYRSRMLLLFGAGLGASIAASIAVGLFFRGSLPGANFWVDYLVMLAPFAVMFAAMMPWWRRLDDLQKSGQLISWYWGGQVGAVLVLMAIAAKYGLRSDFMLGGAAVFVGEVAFFVIAWLIWNVRVKGPAE